MILTDRYESEIHEPEIYELKIPNFQFHKVVFSSTWEHRIYGKIGIEISNGCLILKSTKRISKYDVEFSLTIGDYLYLKLTISGSMKVMVLG